MCSVWIFVFCSSDLYAQAGYCVFFFKQKTAYEMRISDWSSDVCSSDLHAETVIQRHRDAQPVLRREVHLLGDEMPVVDDVVMGQRRALGQAGRAAGELDVDRLVGIEAGRHHVEPRALGRTGQRQYGLIILHAGRRLRAEPADAAQMRSEERRVGKECVRTW